MNNVKEDIQSVSTEDTIVSSGFMTPEDKTKIAGYTPMQQSLLGQISERLTSLTPSESPDALLLGMWGKIVDNPPSDEIIARVQTHPVLGTLGIPIGIVGLSLEQVQDLIRHPIRCSWAKQIAKDTQASLLVISPYCGKNQTLWSIYSPSKEKFCWDVTARVRDYSLDYQENPPALQNARRLGDFSNTVSALHKLQGAA